MPHRRPLTSVGRAVRRPARPDNRCRTC